MPRSEPERGGDSVTVVLVAVLLIAAASFGSRAGVSVAISRHWQRLWNVVGSALRR